MINRSISTVLGILVVVQGLALADSSDKKAPSVYNPVGKRDPFKVLNSTFAGRKVSSIYPTEKYDLDQLSLKAVFRISGKSRAMVEAPDGLTFVIFEGDLVGRERATLSRILKTEIIFTQKTFNYLGNPSLVERIMSLPPDEVSIQSDLASQRNTDSAKANNITKDKDEGLINGTIQNVLDRPKQLEKQFDEIVGTGAK